MNSQQFTTEIRYNRSCRDYTVIVNGECIGFADSAIEAERMAHEHITFLLELDARITSLEQVVS